MKRRLILFATASVLLAAVFALSALPTMAQVALALDRELARLPRLGTIIYVTAHPDDESAAVLTYLARGMNANVVLISMTRGEGGQNSEGSELNVELGWIRQRELESAGAAYGVEVRILGAADFGYSKHVEETMERWDADALVAELCQQIRTLQPVAIFSAWTGTPSDGSSHHQTAGMLTRRAFVEAADAAAFPEQLAEGLLPWATPYLVIRDWSEDAEDAQFEVPAREIVPGTGKTYEEVGWEGFRNHRTQGMANAGRRVSDVPARFRQYRQRVAVTSGDLVSPTTVEDVAPKLSRLTNLFNLFDESEKGAAQRAAWEKALTQAEMNAVDARAMAQTNPGAAARKLIESASLLGGLNFADDIEVEAEPETEAEAETHDEAVTGEVANVDEAAEPTEAEMTLEQARAEAWVRKKRREFLHAATRIAGVELRAVTASSYVVPGESIEVRLSVGVANRAVFDAAGLRISGAELETPEGWKVERLPAGAEGTGNESGYLVTAPEDADASAGPALFARADLRAGEHNITLRIPVKGVWSELRGSRADSILEKLDPRRFDPRMLDPRRLLRLGRNEKSGEGDAEMDLLMFEPVRVMPRVGIVIEPRLRLVSSNAGETTADFTAEVQGYSAFGDTAIWFDVPSGWYSPPPQHVELKKAGRSISRRITLPYPKVLKPGRHGIKVTAGRGLEKFRDGVRRIARGPSLAGGNLPPIYFTDETLIEIQVIDVEVPMRLRVGYIGFPDDPVPDMLEDLGIQVNRLDEVELAFGRLSDYSTIVVANRVYDLRTDLVEYHDRLMEYVREGGVLLVEHQGRRWDIEKFAPYPGKMSGRPTLRVTDETAPVKILDATHSVVRYPNAIGDKDWEGWVQERGLYFWKEWSNEYTPLLEMSDSNEAPLRGSLLYGRYGDGVYIYSGLALFRQVRAGVPGGIRLYVNLLSQGRALGISR